MREEETHTHIRTRRETGEIDMREEETLKKSRGKLNCT